MTNKCEPISEKIQTVTYKACCPFVCNGGKKLFNLAKSVTNIVSSTISFFINSSFLLTFSIIFCCFKISPSINASIRLIMEFY